MEEGQNASNDYIPREDKTKFRKRILMNERMVPNDIKQNHGSLIPYDLNLPTCQDKVEKRTWMTQTNFKLSCLESSLPYILIIFVIVFLHKSYRMNNGRSRIFIKKKDIKTK